MPLANISSVLVTPFLICLCILVPGLSWGWIAFGGKQQNKLSKSLNAFVCAGSTGLCISAITALLTGHLGVFNTKNLFASLSLISAAGIYFALKHNKEKFKTMLAALPAPGSFFFIACAAVMLLPNTGEWIAGGWDPGVYLNTGINVGQTGTFTPQDKAFGSDVTPAERSHFMRYPSNRSERFPGILSNKNGTEINFHFFHLSPAATAVFYKCGKIKAALKTNFFLGILAAMFLFALALRLSGTTGALFATLLLILNPVFVYHLQTPVSEMAELAIAAALLFFLTNRNKHPWLIALLMSAGVMNKFTFLPFGSLLIFFCALADSKQNQTQGVLKSRLIMCTGLLIGAGVDFYTSWISVTGWQVLDKILYISAAGIIAAFAVDIFRTPIGKINTNHKKFNSLLVTAIMLPLIIWFALPTLFPKSTDSANLIRYINYTGMLLFAASLAGMLIFVYQRKKQSPESKIIFAYLATVSALVLTHKFIVPVYPWATRRFLSFTLQLSCLLAGFGLAAALGYAKTLKQPAYRKTAVCALVVFCALSLALPLPKTARVLKSAEYNGLYATLKQLSEKIDTNTLVVADHFWYGTPLAIIFGKQVLNGERIHCPRGRHNFNSAVNTLQKISASGRKVVFVTSTQNGTGIYPGNIPATEVLYQTETKKFNTVAHHPKLNDYVTKSINTVFTIYKCE